MKRYLRAYLEAFLIFFLVMSATFFCITLTSTDPMPSGIALFLLYLTAVAAIAGPVKEFINKRELS